jgi:two-component SAPR family response regulator
MIRDVERWRAFEAAWASAQTTDHAENLRLADAMYQLARALGRFTADDAVNGIEKTIRLANLLHRVRGTP